MAGGRQLGGEGGEAFVVERSVEDRERLAGVSARGVVEDVVREPGEGGGRRPEGHLHVGAEFARDGAAEPLPEECGLVARAAAQEPVLAQVEVHPEAVGHHGLDPERGGEARAPDRDGRVPVSGGGVGGGP